MEAWMPVFLVSVLCRPADQSSRGVLESVERLSVSVKPQQWGGPGSFGDFAPYNIELKFVYCD
jgi:hypothetical protein